MRCERGVSFGSVELGFSIIGLCPLTSRPRVVVCFISCRFVPFMSLVCRVVVVSCRSCVVSMPSHWCVVGMSRGCHRCVVCVVAPPCLDGSRYPRDEGTAWSSARVVRVLRGTHSRRRGRRHTVQGPVPQLPASSTSGCRRPDHSLEPSSGKYPTERVFPFIAAVACAY